MKTEKMEVEMKWMVNNNSKVWLLLLPLLLISIDIHGKEKPYKKNLILYIYDTNLCYMLCFYFIYIIYPPKNALISFTPTYTFGNIHKKKKKSTTNSLAFYIYQYKPTIFFFSFSHFIYDIFLLFFFFFFLN